MISSSFEIPATVAYASWPTGVFIHDSILLRQFESTVSPRKITQLESVLVSVLVSIYVMVMVSVNQCSSVSVLVLVLVSVKMTSSLVAESKAKE
jgi:uncharacterized membrane protein